MKWGSATGNFIISTYKKESYLLFGRKNILSFLFIELKKKTSVPFWEPVMVGRSAGS
jgi:hypothetical protein